MRTGRDCAIDLDPDAEQVAQEPMVHVDPAQYHRQRGPLSKEAGRDASEQPQHRRRIKDRRVRQRPQEGHQMSAQTARRRSRYLLYSPKSVRRLGSVRAASVTSAYLLPSPFSNPWRPRRMCQSLVISRSEWKLRLASQREAFSALERVSTDSLPRSTQQPNHLFEPGIRAARSALVTRGSAPATSTRCAL